MPLEELVGCQVAYIERRKSKLTIKFLNNKRLEICCADESVSLSIELVEAQLVEQVISRKSC